MRKFVVIGVVLVLVLGLPLTAAGWSGVVQVPVVSALFGNDHARDLGMPRDRQAFEAFCTKFGIDTPSADANYTLASPHQWSGSTQIDGVLSEAALGSLHEFNTENPYLSNVNFRIHAGGVELAAFVKSVPGYPFSGPVYGKFSLERTSSSAVAIHISQLQFGNIGVPGDYVQRAETEIGSYLNANIAEAGIKIDALELREGGVYFKGTWPSKITADSPGAGLVP